MSEKRFVVKEDSKTDKIILLLDYERIKIYSFLAEEREGVQKICDLLNELEREKKYWRHALMECDSHRRILVNKSGHVRQDGYDFRAPYQKYIEERVEWMKKNEDKRRIKTRRLI